MRTPVSLETLSCVCWVTLLLWAERNSCEFRDLWLCCPGGCCHWAHSCCCLCHEEAVFLSLVSPDLSSCCWLSLTATLQARPAGSSETRPNLSELWEGQSSSLSNTLVNHYNSRWSTVGIFISGKGNPFPSIVHCLMEVSLWMFQSYPWTSCHTFVKSITHWVVGWNI
jgi:hypothetical protein